MIVFDNVTKVYPGGNTALKNVSLHIHKGEFVFVLGHSGAGKSTFLKLILREEKATSGHVLVDGKDLSRLKEREVPYLRRNMGVVFQDFRLMPSMTAYENVAFAMRVTNIPEKKIVTRCPTCSIWWAFPARWTNTRMNSPAASSSAWPWPAPWCTAPSSSSPTSPPATSTPS